MFCIFFAETSSNRKKQILSWNIFDSLEVMDLVYTSIIIEKNPKQILCQQKNNYF